MKKVGEVFSKVLGEWLDLYEVEGKVVPCICDRSMKCWFHK